MLFHPQFALFFLLVGSLSAPRVQASYLSAIYPSCLSAEGYLVGRPFPVLTAGSWHPAPTPSHEQRSCPGFSGVRFHLALATELAAFGATSHQARLAVSLLPAVLSSSPRRPTPEITALWGGEGDGPCAILQASFGQGWPCVSVSFAKALPGALRSKGQGVLLQQPHFCSLQVLQGQHSQARAIPPHTEIHPALSQGLQKSGSYGCPCHSSAAI